MTDKSNKIVKITAIAGTFAAVTATLVAFLTHFKKKKATDVNDKDQNNDKANSDHDISELDISSIDNDTPRQYVSISINEHIDGENE